MSSMHKTSNEKNLKRTLLFIHGISKADAKVCMGVSSNSGLERSARTPKSALNSQVPHWSRLKAAREYPSREGWGMKNESYGRKAMRRRIEDFPPWARFGVVNESYARCIAFHSFP